MDWINIEEKLPDLHENVLILYKKKKVYVMTEGFLADDAIDCATASHSVEFWRSTGRGLTWYDTQRQIQSLNAKTSKNKVTHWAILPDKPSNLI